MMPNEALPSVAEWVTLWSGEVVRTGTPEEIVGPLLTFNRWRRTADIEGDVRVLVVEQQGVWLWGHSPTLGFVERENEQGVDWRPTLETESVFWLHHAAFEFLSSKFAAYRSTNDVPASLAEIVEHATNPLPCRAWTWPGRQHMRYRGSSLAMICEDGGYYYVQLGAPTEDALNWTDSLGISWNESDSRRE